MKDGDLIEPYAVQVIYVDAWTKFTNRNGVMSCVGYHMLDEGKVAHVRLVWPAVSTGPAVDQALEALADPAPATISPPPPKLDVH